MMQTVAMMFLFIIFTGVIVLLGFDWRGFHIPTKFQFCLAVLLFLVFRFLFSNHETFGQFRKMYRKEVDGRKKHRRKIDKINTILPALKDVNQEAYEKFKKMLALCIEKYPEKLDRRKTYRREADKSNTFRLDLREIKVLS